MTKSSDPYWRELLQVRQAVGRALVLGERPTSLLELALGHERAARAPDRDRLGLAGRPAVSPAVPSKRLVRRHPPSLDGNATPRLFVRISVIKSAYADRR